MRLYYRISDKSYEKPKLMGASKQVCLENFCSVFHIDHQFGSGNPFKVVADRCGDATMTLLGNLPHVQIDLGNAGSLWYTLNLALEESKPDDLIYFCEDDYLHLPKSFDLLKEGIKRAEYVTLYDHPDKYSFSYDGGETSKVIRTESSHWRYTVSTCMTFGVKAKTLKEDLDIWREFTDGDHPHDHFIFQKLSSEKRRRLAVCIPGTACHTDLTFSGKVRHVVIEPWAIWMMENELSRQIQDKLDGKPEEAKKEFLETSKAMTLNKFGWQKLVALDALLKTAL